MKNSLSLVALVGLSVGISSATIINRVDSFDGDNGPQQVGAIGGGLCPSQPAGNPNTSTTTDVGGGGTRTMFNGNTPGCATMDVNFSTSGALSVNQPVGGQGVFDVIWNGAGLDADVLWGFDFRARQDAHAPPNEATSVQFRACQDTAGTVGCVDSTVATINSQTFTTYSTTFGS
ncbi:MAG: hypothetical protein FJW31_22780 [Acidobacteria bacterium]|nr:hypothetical protein [Acidobacteriota bacterium]